MVLGRKQERALRQAADAAVWATAEEMSPAGGEQAVQVAMVISEVFDDPVPTAPLARPMMLLEVLHAGIAGQLAVLNDAELTGTGQSSADVLGVPTAAHAPLDDPAGVATLLDYLREAGADEQAAALLARDPAAHAALDNPSDVGWLLGSLRRAGADEQTAALADRAADAPLDEPRRAWRRASTLGSSKCLTCEARSPAAPSSSEEAFLAWRDACADRSLQGSFDVLAVPPRGQDRVPDRFSPAAGAAAVG